MSFFSLQARARAPRTWVLGLSLLLEGSSLYGCAEEADPVENVDEEIDEVDEEPRVDAGRSTVKLDAGGKTTPPPVRNDAGTATPDTGMGNTMRDASVTPPAPRADAGPTPGPAAPRDLTPSKDNIKECPPVAPDNPVGSCIGVPIYATCSYTSYNCICDWYHWICI